MVRPGLDRGETPTARSNYTASVVCLHTVLRGTCFAFAYTCFIYIYIYTHTYIGIYVRSEGRRRDKTRIDETFVVLSSSSGKWDIPLVGTEWEKDENRDNRLGYYFSNVGGTTVHRSFRLKKKKHNLFQE